MKEKLKNKKVVYTIIGIVSVLLVALAVTYAYWLVTKTQTGENEITAGCLDITISGEKNDINLTNEFPISDEDGMKLVPYEFTVTNNCNTSVDYQVALEATGDSSNAISSSALKVALDDSSKLYSAYPNVETTINGAYESRVLGYSKLAAAGSEGSSATYKLRIWIDADAPISEMNKTFKSKISVTIGQGIESPYKEGTLAYSILANAGGAGATSEIDADVWNRVITATGNQSISTSRNYYYGTEYTFDETTGKYTLSGDLVQATLTECRNGTKTCGKYTLKDTSSTYSSKTLYEVTDFQSSGNYVTANTWKYVNEFSEVTDSSEAGVYKTQDDLGDSYYFRGAPSNNYVQFGSYAANSEVNGTTYTEETPIYWRIVRINGDGTIRMIYDGVEKVANGIAHTATIGLTAYNTKTNDAKYIGYTYNTSDTDTTQVDSSIKGVIDAWYDKNLETIYGKYITDSIFCNDREETSISGSKTYYASYDRLGSNKAPSLKCTNKSDRYTVEDTTNGNGLLSNPVGLITADEVVFAGGHSFTNNTSYYLYTGEYYWTSAPIYFDGNRACVWAVSNVGRLDYWSGMDDGTGTGVSYKKYGSRPVINLKANVKSTGTGTIDDPYVIVTE